MPEIHRTFAEMRELAMQKSRKGGKQIPPEQVDCYVAFGKRLRRLREGRDWSMRDMDSKSGLDPGTIARIEKGERPMLFAATLMRIAEALHVNPLYLWYGDSRGHVPNWKPQVDFSDVEDREDKRPVSHEPFGGEPVASGVVRKQPVKKSV